MYRAPWAKSADTIEFCQLLDNIVINYNNIVITGDFNIPNWNNDTAVKLGDGQIIRNFANEHNLLQIAKSATRKLSYLDLIFVSSRFQQCHVIDIEPLAGSDHSAQLLYLPNSGYVIASQPLTYVINYEQL